MEEDRLRALTIAFEMRAQKLDFAGGIEEGEAWVVAHTARSRRYVVTRVRIGDGLSGPALQMATWEFSAEELEAERARMRGEEQVTVDQIVRAVGREDGA